MNSQGLPPGWKDCGEVSQDQIYTEPEQPADLGRVRLFGMLEYDSYRLYDLPANTPLSDIVDYFRVGSHGAMNLDAGPDEFVLNVASVADRLRAVLPVRPFFADGAGLKVRFLREISDDDFSKISALFPEEEMCELGLERYIANWDGESPILEPIKREGFLHLWWD